MARRSKAEDVWNSPARDQAVDGVFGAMAQSAQNQLGRKVSVGAEAANDHVGLPLPALALRYLIKSTVWPLSRITQITGEEGSCKTAFAAEVSRWHAVYGGGGVLAENENKDATDLRCAIWHWKQEWLNRCQMIKTYSVEDWQDVFTTFTRIARESQDEVKGPGRTIPIAFTVDSIMGTALRAQIESIEKEGHADPGFAKAAKSITEYMRTMPHRIQDYPFSVIGTNHLKPGIAAGGIPTSTVPGGKSVKFHETFEIEMSKAWGADINRLDYGGLRCKFVCRKNSIGPSRMAIVAEFLWWYEDDGNGGMRQQASWDWDTASIEMLLSFATIPGKKTIYDRLQEVCDVRIANKSNRTAWSRTLAIPESDPQPYRVLGAALERRPDVLWPIYRTLGIMPRRPFQPGLDYRTIKDIALQDAQAAEMNLYGPQALPVKVGAVGGEAVEPEAPPRPGDEENEAGEQDG